MKKKKGVCAETEGHSQIERVILDDLKERLANIALENKKYCICKRVGEMKKGVCAETEGQRQREGVTLDDLKERMANFAKERDWDQFHSPRNILLALVGEVGELSEIFQWKGEVPRELPDWAEEEKVHLGDEISDVLLYLVRLSDVCGIDLGKAALRKLEHNAKKYPVHLCKGSSQKYYQIHNTKNYN